MMISINPPPDDLICEICGTHVSQLEPFDEEFCTACETIEHYFSVSLGNVISLYITPDHSYQNISDLLAMIALKHLGNVPIAFG